MGGRGELGLVGQGASRFEKINTRLLLRICSSSCSWYIGLFEKRAPPDSSLEEAQRGSQRKWRALGKADPKRKLPVLNFGGQSQELWCEGGEIGFVTQLIKESTQLGRQVLWFSTLVSKASNLPLIQSTLKKVGAVETRIVEMGQGQKQSRFVAWTFHDKAKQEAWRQERWSN